MKSVILYYILVLLVCFTLGLICSLIHFYSWWYLLLLIFPISFGWIPFALMQDSLPQEKADNAGCIVTIAFIVLALLLIVEALLSIEELFWERTYVASLFAALIAHVVLMVRIKNKVLFGSWRNFKKTKSVSEFWCRFFQY